MASNSVWSLVLVLAIVGLAVTEAEASISCSTVVTYMMPCQNYLMGGAPAPAKGCCDGANSLNSLAKTVADRRQVCACLKSLATTLRPNVAKALALASRCHVNLNGISVTANIDCSAIH